MTKRSFLPFSYPHPKQHPVLLVRKIPSHLQLPFPTPDLSLKKKTSLWNPLMYTDLSVSRLVPGSHRYCCDIISQHSPTAWLSRYCILHCICGRYNTQKYCIQCSEHTSIMCKYKIYNHNVYNTFCCLILLLYNYIIIILLFYHSRHQATN